jgi:uncharacterized membrane protein
MQAGRFIRQLRESDISAAIRAAEQKTSGEIRVLISRRKPKNAVEAARKAFVKLGMTRTRLRNAVLIYVAPRARQLAVIGDKAVHERCGEQFWQEVAEQMATQFKASKFTDGIVGAIQKVGELLALHFPRMPDDKNELPNSVAKE